MEYFLQAYAVAGAIFGQVIKAVGFPAKYIVLANIGLAAVIGGLTMGWDLPSMIQALEAGLAATGVYEVVKRVSS